MEGWMRDGRMDGWWKNELVMEKWWYDLDEWWLDGG